VLLSLAGMITTSRRLVPLSDILRGWGVVATQVLFVKEKAVIEKDVWLGYGVNSAYGVTVGRGSIVAAGSVVTKDIQLIQLQQECLLESLGYASLILL